MQIANHLLLSRFKEYEDNLAGKLVLSVPSSSIYLINAGKVQRTLPYYCASDFLWYKPYSGYVYPTPLLRSADFAVYVPAEDGTFVSSEEPTAVNTARLRVLDWFKFYIFKFDDFYIPVIIYTGNILRLYYEQLIRYMRSSFENFAMVCASMPYDRSTCLFPIMTLDRVPTFDLKHDGSKVVIEGLLTIDENLFNTYTSDIHSILLVAGISI